MQVGHIFTIEPMINEGKKSCVVPFLSYISNGIAGTFKSITWPDRWTAATADGKRSAQFEHTIASKSSSCLSIWILIFVVTDSGVEVLTRRIETSPRYFWERESDTLEF
jgi:methionyl aminopeptidase